MTKCHVNPNSAHALARADAIYLYQLKRQSEFLSKGLFYYTHSRENVHIMVCAMVVFNATNWFFQWLISIRKYSWFMKLISWFIIFEYCQYRFEYSMEICCTNRLQHYVFLGQVKEHPWLHSQFGIYDPYPCPGPCSNLRNINFKDITILCTHMDASMIS